MKIWFVEYSTITKKIKERKQEIFISCKGDCYANTQSARNYITPTPENQKNKQNKKEKETTEKNITKNILLSKLKNN